jgi:hypothetical protein
MADIRCPNCGRDNPDFLDLCQFCQTPLQPDPMLQTGETPTKKNTGELEGILPAWLQDVRQQGRDSAAEDAIEAAATPQVQKEAAPDLLAGLASQSSSDEDEVPDWLASLNPVENKASSTKSASESVSPSDFFSQFEQEESQPAPSPNISGQAETPSWMGTEAQPSEENDELSDWLSKASDVPGESLHLDADTTNSEGWKPPEQEPQESKEPEDLSWLHNLEASSRQPEPSTPQTNMDWASNFDAPASSQPSDSEEDLGWLKNLGGMSLPASDEPAPSKAESSQGEDLGWLKNLGSDSGISPDEESPAILPASTGEDLDWLKNLGGETAPAVEEPASAQPESQQSDLGWLNDFGDTSKPAFDEPVPAQSSSSQDNLDWLKNLGDVNTPAFEESAPVQPESSQDDLSWLNSFGSTPGSALDETPTILPSSSSDELDSLVNLGGMEKKPSTEMPPAQPFAGQDDLDWLKNINEQQNVPPAPASPVSPFMPRRTAPLEGTDDKAVPDWLKSATEGPSIPPPGGASLDWFKSQESADKQPPLSTPEPASAQPGVPSSISNQDVDSMFAVEMPDWLSQQPDTTKESPSQEVTPSTQTGDLAPVDLPSWVQAMRPVEAAIDEVSAGAADQVTEREGPLAGFRGLIPSAPIGSSRRPKAVSLKLQATDEQQANAALLEQIIAGETTAHPIKTSSVVAPQRVLRWVLALVFLVVLGSVIGLGSQSMPIFAPAKVNELSALIATVPDASPVLVVIDYQPSLVGELEAASGPLLDQMALSRHAQFTFLSTSPNGSALVERLMNNTKLSRSAEDGGLGYQLGTNYFNIGFLPGDSAGVLEFVEKPKMAMPSVNMDAFSQFTAVVVLTDHAESGRVWVEQLEQAKQKDPTLASQKLVIVSSAQAGPLLEPYVSSGQVDAMISGLSDAAQYEHVNVTRPGIARTYWDAFGVGLMMAIVLIVFGSLWSLISGIRARRAEAEQG